MKKSNWLILALAAAGAAALRVLQNLTGFDADGLAIPGNLPGILLPVLLVLAACYFILSARKLPRRGKATLRGMKRPAAICAVLGTFLVLAGSVLLFLSSAGSAAAPVLAVFLCAAAFSLLYAIFALYRGGEAPGLALLVPVCCLVVNLFFLYRSTANNPVLASVYIGILAFSALTFSSLERAAFAFKSGAPRAYLPACAMAALLSLCEAAERRDLPSLLLFIGFAVVELGFLAAADFEISAETEEQ